ncbi:unnamed protein product [Oppiella nova]|uniref:Rap guanine nucleotide exchange factor 1 n=1 Tax=Oppiella nova TaxID=334625 RepID=A0A7R9QNP4_9ACAR|nr:unnamed protein product [Oppiella nova]CAG2169956.1 unnamed protein product [Oppiella nova]
MANRLCIDRYNNRETTAKSSDDSSGTSTLSTQTLGRLSKKPDPISLALKGSLLNASSHRSSLPEIPLSPREKEILETTNFPIPPPVPYRTAHADRLNHSLSSDDVLNNSSNDVFDGPMKAPPKPPLPVIDGRPLSVSDILEFGEEEGVPPPLPPKRFPRPEKVLYSQTSFDWSQTCQSSNCTSNCNSVDSCLNYSGLSHLSADDLLSISRSDANSDYRRFRSQLNSYNTTSSEENKSTNSFNFSHRYEYKSSVTQTKTQTIHSVNNESKDSLTFSLSSPPFHSYRMDSLIDKMRTFSTGEDTVDGDTPPQLPVKMRPKLSLSNIQNILDSKPMRPLSEYDNIIGTPDSSHLSHNCGHDIIQRLPNNQINIYCLQPNSCPHSSSCPHFMNNAPTLQVTDSSDLESKPPPLPPKRRNIMAYMEMVDSYNGPESAEFYRHSMHTYASIENQWQAMERSIHSSFIQQRSIATSFVSGSSDDSVFSFGEDSRSENSSTPPPLLPPKQRKSVLTALSKPPNESPEMMPRTSTPVSLVPSSDSGISSQPELTRAETEEPEEVSALDETDVSVYIVLKNTTEEGPEIRGGSVDGLIVKATEVSKNDFMFQEAFLTTYRTLLTPMELIDKLLYRYNKFILLSDMRQRAARNAFALLVRVVDDIIGDYSDKVLEILMDFIYQLVNRGDLALAKVLRAKCIEKMDQRQHALNASKVLLPSINITSRQYSLCDFKSEHLAEQMTLLDSDLFLKIEIPEVLVWAKEQKEELIPNLNTFTEHFNNMSYWTRSRILDEKDARERERLVLKFIKIMKHLRKLSNFNSYLAILSALDSAPIRRLEWQRNITESLKEYSALIDSSSSFRAYRQALAYTEPPCIPYMYVPSHPI